ncbi:NAD(P)H-hydrate dehydratase [Oleiagrimonas sp.]|jgi:hydroxyethylthiazole kinase-like uncharacterized protein yjeF|uniref:NAD(P)H-hydrate dehydratase n=1 Tax=Oleiagrimonas sp. TaxID=2010330 RepID=UPI00262D8AA5|nr:NAD(P)H-hydrate dehydratase [Oleiagrimonas sp.]MDA3912627.1 NAD(P)H-hydrate dehydratase [Oleiagrimonas sp.]
MNERLHRSLYTAAQVRALDRHAIEDLGIPGFTLMQRASGAALHTLRQRWPQSRSLLLLCGPGNNGGDAYLLGALALGQGIAVTAVALSDALQGDAARARQAFLDAGGVIELKPDTLNLSQTDLVVDGLFGTGLSRAPEGLAADWIRQVHASSQPVLALDVPSGLDSDTGVARDPCIRADATVTFVALKRGLFTADAADCCGALQLDTLDLPETISGHMLPDAQILRSSTLPARRSNTHKGSHGHVLALGGDSGMGGAIRLCGEAALRSGAGLVSVATRASHISALNGARPELMAHAVENTRDLMPLLDAADVLALGPGLGQGEWGRAVWEAALSRQLPVVVDADALNLLAAHTRALPHGCVLTPHPGEAARLLATDIAAVQADRFAAVRALAERHQACVVLKGAGSLIASPDGQVSVCPWGNPGMASGGMGDLLTGVIAALMAQGLSALDAACMGVGLHARAGDRGAAHGGERGLLASDLLLPLRESVNASPE